MNDWKLEITKCDNGYILKGVFGNSDVESEVVIQQDEYDLNGELKAMRDMLWEVKEYFGLYYSKHNKHNLNIKIEPPIED